MNALKTARMRIGMKQNDLAELLGVTQQQIANWETGFRRPGPKYIPELAKALDCNEAYLLGKAEFIPVTDFENPPPKGFAQKGITAICEIIRTERIEGYGVFYIVDHPEIGWMAVILADGIQFTTQDWQGAQPCKKEEIVDFAWMTAERMPAVMLDGLPRVII